MSWRFWEIRDEWQAFKPHLSRLSRAVRRFELEETGHAFVNIFVEFYRGFAYTLGHVTVLVLFVLIAMQLGAWIEVIFM